jgi:hypothetical protein
MLRLLIILPLFPSIAYPPHSPAAVTGVFWLKSQFHNTCPQQQQL